MQTCSNISANSDSYTGSTFKFSHLKLFTIRISNIFCKCVLLTGKFLQVFVLNKNTGTQIYLYYI